MTTKNYFLYKEMTSTAMENKTSPIGLSTDELKVLANRNKVKNYGSLSRQKLEEKLSDILGINEQIPLKFEENKHVQDLTQLEKRVLAQRVGITNIRKIPKKQLAQILEENLNQEKLNIPEIKSKPTKAKISIKKPLLAQAKEQGYHNYHNLNIEKLKELLKSPPVKKILKSDLIKQAKDIGVEIKKSMKKSFIADLIEKHTEFKQFKKNSAFKGYVNHFRIEGLNKIESKLILRKNQVNFE